MLLFVIFVISKADINKKIWNNTKINFHSSLTQPNAQSIQLKHHLLNSIQIKKCYLVNGEYANAKDFLEMY